MNREQFMEFFRRKDFHDQITVDDAQEIFSSVLHGSDDVTLEILSELLIDYGIYDLLIVPTSK